MYQWAFCYLDELRFVLNYYELHIYTQCKTSEYAWFYGVFLILWSACSYFYFILHNKRRIEYAFILLTITKKNKDIMKRKQKEELKTNIPISHHPGQGCFFRQVSQKQIKSVL